MQFSTRTTIRRGVTAAWVAVLTFGWMTTLGIGAGAIEGDDSGPVAPAGVVLSVPIGGAVHGDPGSSSLRASTPVPAELQGLRCDVRVEGENQWSVHPGNDLVVTTGSETVVAADFEGAAHAVTSVTAGSVVLGSSLDVSVRFGDDGVSSGGVRVVVDGCVVPGPPPSEVPSTTPTTDLPETTVPASTIPDSTVPESTVPQSTVPQNTVPSTTAPATTEPVPAGPTTAPSTTVPSTTVSSVAPTTAPEAAAPSTEPPTTPPTSTEVAGPVASPTTTQVEVESATGEPDPTAEVQVAGLQQLPETGAETTVALLGATLVTIGRFLVGLERRLTPATLES